MAFFIIGGGIMSFALLLTLAADEDKHPGWNFAGKMIIAMTAILLFLVGFVAGVSWLDRDNEIEKTMTEYTYLTALYESEAFADDPENMYKLYEDIIDYNEKIDHAHKQMNSEFGNIFYPKSVWEDVPHIDLKL